MNTNARAALELCGYMDSMGAQHCTIPVEVNRTNYIITISRTLRKRKSRVVANPPTEISEGILGTNKNSKQINEQKQNEKLQSLELPAHV